MKRHEGILVADLIAHGFPEEDWDDISIFPDFVTVTINGERVIAEPWQFITKGYQGIYFLSNDQT